MGSIHACRHLLAIHRRFLLTASMFLILSAPSRSHALAPWTWQDNPALPAEPSNHVSFVRGFDNQYVLVDWQLKKDILEVVKDRFGRIDIVMQQCNGGGFLNDVRSATGVPRTFVSASAWYETSWNVVQAKNTPLALWNFTDEWQADARSTPRRGLREIAYHARRDDWVGPVSNAFKPSVAEHPQYYSPDNPAGGANDTATLGAQAGVRQYAILAGWGPGDTLKFRHQVNLARMYDLLRNEYQAPANQVAVLWDDGTYNLSAPRVIRPGGQDLDGVPVDRQTSRENWVGSLKGLSWPTNPSTTNDKLLVYFTGHGGHAEWRRNAWQPLDKNFDQVNDGGRWRITWTPGGSSTPSTNAFTGAPPAGGAAEASANPQMLGDRDEDGLDHIQMHFREDLSFNLAEQGHASLFLNGVDVTSDVYAVTGADVLNIPPQNESDAPLYSPYVYQVDVQRSLELGADPYGVTIELGDLTAGLVYQNLLLAADFRSGDQEFLTVNVELSVPEPGSILPLILGVSLFIRPRLRGRL